MNRRDFIQGVIAASAVTAVASCSLGGESKEQVETSRKQEKKMNVLIFTGSPRKNGNSSILASEFQRGAEEARHKVTVFEGAFKKVHPCIACDHCMSSGDCVFDDDYKAIAKDLIAADVIVFASPVYYFAMTAQIKACIDRFYAYNTPIAGKKKAYLLLTFADTNDQVAMPSVANYKAILNYRHWTDAGQILAHGVWGAGDVKNTKFPQMAYEMGKSIAG